MSNSVDNSSEHAVKGVEVFVGGLPRNIAEAKIREVFSVCGEITEIRLIKDQKGNLKGFGFVRFATKEAADRAVNILHESMLEGKKIGVLPSSVQDTLFLGNLHKGWSADDFENVVRLVFPDVISVELSMPSNTDETSLNKKYQNRGFGFVKFSSHAAAARAYRVGTKPDFLLGGSIHPSVEWAEEDSEIDPKELAKVKVAFIRSLPSGVDENFLKKHFLPFGKVEKLVVSKKGQSSVGFVHFAQRSDLDKAINGLNGKAVQGPGGVSSFKLQVEVARPMDKKRKRVREESESKQISEISSQPKIQKYELSMNSLAGHEPAVEKKSEIADPYEAAVLLLPVAVKERLLRILRLLIATRFDIDIQCLVDLRELPEASAIAVLDQFMISAADKNDKAAYLAGLISRYQVDKLGLNQLSRAGVGDIARRESNLYSLSGVGVRLPTVDSPASHVSATVASSDDIASRYTSLYMDYPLSSRAGIVKIEEKCPVPLHPYAKLGIHSVYGIKEESSSIPVHQISGSSTAYRELGVDSHIPAAADRQPIHIPAAVDCQPSPHIPAAVDRQPTRIPAAVNRQAAHISAAVDHQPTYIPAALDHQPTSIPGAADRQRTRPQVRFDPFTGKPYKFDPFTGEPILPEGLPPKYGSPYQ